MFMSRRKRNKKRFAVSPLISAIILIAITITGGLIVFAVWNSMAGTSSKKTQVNFDYLALYKTVGEPEAVFAATLKNAGNKPIKLLIIKLHNEMAYTVPSINASSPLEPGRSVGVTLTPPKIHAEWYIVGNFYTVTIVKAEATDDSSFSHVITVMCLGFGGEAPTDVSFKVLGLHSYGPVIIVDGVEYSHPDLPLEFTWKVGSVHTYYWWGAVRDVYDPSNYMWTVGAWDQTTGIVADKDGVVTVPKGGGNITAEFKPGYYFYDDFETGDFRKETVYTKFVQPWYYSNASVGTADVGGGNYSASFFTAGQVPSALQWPDSNIPAWAYKTLPSDWGNEIWLDFKAKSTSGDVALFSSIFPLCSMSIGGMSQRCFDPPKYSALVLTYTGSKFQLLTLHTILGHEDDDVYFSHELGTYPADQWYDICIVLNRNGHEGWVKVFINGDQKCFLTLTSSNAPDFYAYGTPNMVLVGEYREFTPGTTLIDDLMLFTSRYIPEAFRETCDSGEALVTFDTNWDIDMNQAIVEIDNVTYPRWQLPVSYAWPIGSTHHYEFLTKNVEDGKRYEVIRVSGLSNNAQGNITVPEKGGTFFADYSLQYRLTILPALNGSVNLATGEHWYNAGSTVQVTATPDFGNIFAYWMQDGAVRTENPITLAMSQKYALEAIFALPSNVTFCCNVGSDANARVLTVDDVDYYYGQLPKTFTHPINSPHTFNWNSPIGTTETGKAYFWTTTSGLTTMQSDVLVFPDGGGQVNATYTVGYALSISLYTIEGGTTDPAPGTYWYNVGANVSVRAIPDVGCSFDYWLLNDVNVGSANPLTVQMSSHHLLEAAFFSGPVISERITNGGFEDFSLGWTGTGEITGWGHTGEQCLMLYGDEWMQSDNLGNMPAENITYFGFYYIYDEGTTYTIFYTDATNSSDTLTYTGYWTYVDLMLKLVSGKEVSSIYFHGQPGEIAYLDDVSLVADGVERVLNGGFETIIVPGWTGTGGVSGSEAHGGNYSLVLSGSEWYPPIRWMQTNDLGSIPVKRVNSFGFYCISQDFYYRGAVTYTILYTDGSNSSGYISPSTTWEYVDLMPLLVLGKNVSAIHFVSERDNPIWIDDVSLIANNMPLSWYEGVFTISRSDFAVEAYNDFTFTVKLYVASLNQTLGTEMHIIQVHEVEGDYVGCQTVNVYLYVNSSGAYIHAVGGNIGWEGETPMGSGYHECSLGEWHSIYYEHLYIESGDYEHWSFQVDGDELFSGDTLAWSYSYNSITLGSFGAPDPESNFTLYYDAVCWTAGTGDFESSFPGDWTIQGTVGLSTAQSVSPSHSLKVPMIDEPLSVTVTPENAVIGKNTTQTFEAVVAGGSLPYTYAWYVNGTLWMREPGELLTNGNFETGDLSGWQHGGSVGATTDLVHAGSYACEISGSGSYIGQTFTGVPKDKIVSFGFWQRTVGYGQRGIVTIEYNDGTYTVVEADTTGYTWKYVNLLPYVETSKTVTGARFSHNGVASPYYYIDDISLISTEIPETSPTLQFRTEDVGLYEIWCIVTDSIGNTDQSNIVLCSVEE